MELYIMIALRLIHIFSGVFWAGTAFFFISFLQPVVKASGPEGGKVMQRLALSRFPSAMPLIGGLTVLSGLAMYWFLSGGLQLRMIMTAPGLGYTLGGVAALIAFVIGIAVTVPATKGVAAVAKELMASGNPPTPAQMSRIQGMQMKLATGALWNTIFLAVAVAMMAVARYL